MTIEPDFKNPNREPVISLMDLARLDEIEQREGYQDGYEGLPCGDNRSRSYWHGWRQGSRDAGHRAKEGDFWDNILVRNVCPKGTAFSDLPARIEACRRVLSEAEEIA